MIEQIVLVNKVGEPIGTAEKLSTHHANTPLHLAFSCYVFNKQGKLLLTKRAQAKKVWPGVWTNSVCGHPAPKEQMANAIERRLDFELGMRATDIRLLVPDYTYKTPPYNGIIEHEYCPIFVARATSEPKPNRNEVSEYQWVDWQDFITKASADTNDTFSWWCKDQIKLIKDRAEILALVNPG